jgi:nicotinate-nucleotide pyrophosphorylase
MSKNMHVYLLGSIRAVGKVTRSIKAKAKIKVERKSRRKHSHSIAAALYKLGLDKLSIN